jgi:pyruvate, water dikinase
MNTEDLVVPLRKLRMSDVERVGGKNASLGEMLSQLEARGIRVPDGFATTAHAFREFLRANGLRERIAARLDKMDVEDVKALTEAGREIRQWVAAAKIPADLEAAVRVHYRTLAGGEPDISVAVRSSATAEDLPEASFAGQQETFLNVVGADAVLERMREVFASLYNDRAISYRVHHGFAHDEVALSVGVQRMVRSDQGAAGVMFTLDTESGFRDVVFLTANYGLGETVVQGSVNPDEFVVHKPMLLAGKFSIVRRNLGSKLVKMVYEEDAKGSGRHVKTVDVGDVQRHRFSLSDDEVLELARYAVTIEQHYGRPMDIEWGKDGLDGRLYILQARPETVKSRPQDETQLRYRLKVPQAAAALLASGRAIGQKIGVGKVRLVRDASQMDQVQPGDILVTEMTDPNWEPVMKRAAAIVTDRGGRTCHAAIIARELGIPAVVGCSDATQRLADGMDVTVSCAEGDTGMIYAGRLEMEVETVQRGALPDIPVKITMNVGNPQLAFDFQSLPNAGVGLARLEFIINNHIGVHPKAVLDYPKLDDALKLAVEKLAHGYSRSARLLPGPLDRGRGHAGRGLLAQAGDRAALGLQEQRVQEAHRRQPLRAGRGKPHARLSRRLALHCPELCRLFRDGMQGLAARARHHGLHQRRDHGAVRAHLGRSAQGHRAAGATRFAPRGKRVAHHHDVRGALQRRAGRRVSRVLRRIFSIGSNDLTQLTLGLDRDSGLVAEAFDERDPAVLFLIARAIAACRAKGKYVGICGQGPSDHVDFALWLVEQGISSISLNPDSVVDTWRRIAAAQDKRGK